ncbi:hypothetical protein D3C75_795040 [compost metagenome]
MEILLHLIFARRPQIQKERCPAADRVERLQRQLPAQPLGDGHEMDDGIRRAAAGHRNRDSVLHRLCGHNFARADIPPHQLHNLLAGPLGEMPAAAVRRGNRRAARERHANGFGNRGHGARCAHHHAVPVTAADGVLRHRQLLVRDVSRFMLQRKAVAVGAGAQAASAKTAVQHRSARKHNGRNVHTGRSHQLGGHRFVTAAEQYHPVNGMAFHHFLRVHGHQVPQQHRRRLDVRLAN